MRCYADSGKSVSGLDFWKNRLNGNIPSELENLSNLTWLNLGDNSLSGTIPSELGNLKNLALFNLSGNSLSGSIPAELGNLVYLTNFNVRDNNLSGEIPNELGGIKNLTYLDLWGENSFTGSIPREWEKREVLIDQGTRFIDHNNHFIDDVDRDGIDDAIDKDAGSSAKIKTIETADYSISILGSGRVVNLVSNSKYKNEFRDIQRGGNGSRLASSTVKLITNILFKHFEDEFDFIMIASGCSKIGPCVKNNGGTYGVSYGVKNNVTGIARELFDYSDDYGSNGKLKSVHYYPHLNGITMGPSLHELMHTWASKLEILDGYRGDPELVCPGHWGWTNIGGQLGGWKHGSLQALSNGSYQAQGPNNTKQFDGLVNGNSGVSSNSFSYSNFELYMMGIIGADEVGQEIKIAQDFKWKDLYDGTFEASTIHSLTMEEIIADAGIRSPSHIESQKNFRSMYVVVSEEKLKPNEWGFIDQELHRFQLQGTGYSKSIKLSLLNPALPLNFWEATQGKATMTFGQTDTFLKTEAISSPLVDDSDDSPAAPAESNRNTTKNTVVNSSSSSATANAKGDNVSSDSTSLNKGTNSTATVTSPAYEPTVEWPSPYSGVTPDSSYGLEFNNVGVLNSADATIYVCLRIFTEGLPSAVNGVSQFDMGLKVASLSDATVQITKFREFNAFSALNEKGQLPNCSGMFETTTGVYTDIIQTDTSVLVTTWKLIYPTNLILKMENFKELTALTIAEVDAACSGPIDTSETGAPLTLQVDGARAIFRGFIDSTAPAKVQSLIDNNPEVKVIVLAYGPGSIDDDANLEAALLVNQAGLGTCVPENGLIDSGAVDFYLAGVVRRLADSAVVGVHSWGAYSFDGSVIDGSDLPMNDPAHQSYLNFYQQIGVNADFYWFTLQAAPANGMYNMTAEDKVTYQMESM